MNDEEKFYFIEGIINIIKNPTDFISFGKLVKFNSI